MDKDRRTSWPIQIQGEEAGWKSAKVAALRWVNTVPGNLKCNIKGSDACVRSRWVGKAHRDRYLAEFQYRFNRRFDMKSILPRFLTAAVRTPAMPQALLKQAWINTAG
jgi:hypothetical protein